MEEYFSRHEIMVAADQLLNEERNAKLVKLMKGIHPDVLSNIARDEFCLRDRVCIYPTRLHGFHPVKVTPVVTKTVIHPVIVRDTRADKPRLDLGGESIQVTGARGSHGLNRGFLWVKTKDNQEAGYNPQTLQVVPALGEYVRPWWRHDECMIGEDRGTFGLLGTSPNEWIHMAYQDVFLARRGDDGKLEIFKNEMTIESCLVQVYCVNGETVADVEFDNEAWQFTFEPQYSGIIIYELEPGGIISWWSHSVPKGERNQVQLFQGWLDDLQDLPDEMTRLVFSFLVPF